jgi:calcium-dependent protein kinase
LNIKLIDFGLSKIIGIGKNTMQTKLGTPYYVSPEVLEGVYDKKCDMWATGVITYILLSGTPPFNGKTEADVFNKIRCCDFDFPDKHWASISNTAKDFISKLLCPDPNKRMCPEEALNHDWMRIVEDVN